MYSQFHTALGTIKQNSAEEHVAAEAARSRSLRVQASLFGKTDARGSINGGYNRMVEERDARSTAIPFVV